MRSASQISSSIPVKILRLLLSFILFCVISTASIAQVAPTPSEQNNSHLLRVIPYPAQVEIGSGEFIIDNTFSIALSGHTEARLDRAIQRFAATVTRETGIPLQPPDSHSSDAKLLIHCDTGSESVQMLGEDESYSLQVTQAAIHLNAPTPLGVLHGLETILQLIAAGRNDFSVPALTIQDRPRFPWRGLLLDVSRHWMPMEVVERTLDGMAAVKLNVLHWHLSDDQGFRVESKKFPKLYELGSDGNYYTQDQVREILDYARDRGIRVIPEFDMPGHATSWFVGYPELASAPGPYQIERAWGIFDPAMDPTRDSTYKFLDGFIGEMAKLFPDAYFHIGGDEVNGKQWSANEQIKKFMADHQIKDNSELQTYFNTRLLKIVAKHNRIMVGWDEVLHPGLPKDVVIHSWRGQQALAAAARQGYRGLLSNGYYLDLMFSAAYHYAMDPLGGDAAALTDDEKKRIIGGEACMWAEFVTPENVDSRIWPRAAAIAERLWSRQPQDLDSLYARLHFVSEHLTSIGLTQQTNPPQMLQRIAGESDVQPLQTLASVLEPVKEYVRGQTRNYTQSTPLNRLIDAIPPESLTARDFTLHVKRLISHTSTSEDEAAIRTSLVTWRDNDQKFVSANYRSFLAQELFPVSAQLSQITAVGLQALDVLTGKAITIPACDAKRAAVHHATQATPDMLNQVARPILDLLSQACGTPMQ